MMITLETEKRGTPIFFPYHWLCTIHIFVMFDFTFQPPHPKPNWNISIYYYYYYCNACTIKLWIVFSVYLAICQCLMPNTTITRMCRMCLQRRATLRTFDFFSTMSHFLLHLLRIIIDLRNLLNEGRSSWTGHPIISLTRKLLIF